MTKLSLWPNTMQLIASTRSALTSTQCHLCNDVMCTTRRRTSASLEVKQGNPSMTYFQVKKAARSHRVPRTESSSRQFYGATDKL
jgi:hypothetical protein